MGKREEWQEELNKSIAEAKPKGLRRLTREEMQPVVRDAELSSEICALMAEGYSLQDISSLPGMPTRRTINKWILKDKNFQQEWMIAKKIQAQNWAEEIIDIVDDSSKDWREFTKANGQVVKLVDHEVVNRSRLRFDARKHLMARLHPELFGDSQTVRIGGNQKEPVVLEINTSPRNPDTVCPK